MDGTDGVPSGVVESATANDQWDSLLTQAMEATPASAEPSPAGAAVEPSGSPAPATAGDGGAETAPVSATPTPETPAAVETAAPVPETPAAPEVEPKPFEFAVEGQLRTMDGVYRIPGEGLVVPEAQVPAVQRLFAQAITLDKQVRDAVTRANDLERLTEWKITGADGKEQSLKGQEGIQALLTDHDTLKAAFHSAMAMFRESPVHYVAQNEKGEIVWNPEALRQLKDRADLAEGQARLAVQQRFASTPKAPVVSAPSAPPVVDLAAAAPAIIRQTAQNAGLDLSALTPEDGTVIAGMLARFQRPATAEDQQVNPVLKVGEPVIDPSFADYLKDRIALRQNAKKVAEVASAAATFNKGMTAKPAAKPAVPAKPAPLVGKGAPKERPKSGNDMWSELVTEAQSVVGAGRA